MNNKRLYNTIEKFALYITSGGKCEECSKSLQFSQMQGDHYIPFSKGGKTCLSNGRSLCADCNRKKGNLIPTHTIIPTVRKKEYGRRESCSPRKWIQRATERYFELNQTNFLCVSCPSSGKTNFSLAIASELLNRGEIEQLIVVVPSGYLKQQWANNAKQVGIELNPRFKHVDLIEQNDLYDGVCVTFHQVSDIPGIFSCMVRKRSLVIIDEVHHLGTKKHWGEAHNRAFEEATRMLLLSGTPFRSDSTPISFVKYDEEGTCITDFNYSLSEASADGIVRDIEFVKKSGPVSWEDSQTAYSTNLNDELPDDQRRKALCTALTPSLSFISQLLRRADEKLDEVRKEHSDAGGLVIARDIRHAIDLQNKLESITKQKVLIVKSEDSESLSRIEQFRKGQSKWLVSIKMVSEGVDIPRLRVLVYATNVRTNMFFQQAVGRVIRTTNDPPKSARLAYVFTPEDSEMRNLVTNIEQAQKHRLRILEESKKQRISISSERKESAFNPLHAEITESNIYRLGISIINADKIEVESIDETQAEKAMKFLECDFIALGASSMKELAIVLHRLPELTLALPHPQLALYKEEKILRKITERITRKKLYPLYKSSNYTQQDINGAIKYIVGVRREDASLLELRQSIKIQKEFLKDPKKLDQAIQNYIDQK